MAPKRVAVVGSGPSGLTSARHALLNGFDVQIFDKKSKIGGRWNSLNSSQGPYLHSGTKMQYSADLCAFSDFPPSKTGNVMSQSDAAEYLLSYAKTHNLDKMTKLNSDVVEIYRHEQYEKNGKWIIKYKQNDKLQEDEFDAVLVCTGMKQKPWRPNEYRLEREFNGKIRNASEFKSIHNYTNKTVVLVGFGNSAAELARALGPVAKKVYISARKGEWTWKQFDANKQPFDLSYNNRTRYFLRSLIPKYVLNFIWEQQSLADFNYGRRPEHRFLATLPVFADNLDELINSQKLEIEEDLLTFTENGVEFKSGTVVENVDEVIFCTGYKFDFDLIENRRLIVVNDNDFQLYLHMFPVELHEHSTLACIGFIQPQLGCVWPLAELQARLFFSVLSNKLQLPSVFDMRSDAEWRRCCMNLDFLKTRRHTHIEDFVGFSNELSSLIGARPSLKFLLSDPMLTWHYLTGPLTSYQHRLFGPNAWPAARNAAMSVSQKNSSSFLVNFTLAILCVLIAFVLKVLIY